MKKAFLILAIASLPAMLSAKEIKVKYKDVSYSILQDSKNFIYRNPNFTKKYDIKPCNKMQFDFFWSDLKNLKRDISSIVKTKGSTITLTDDGKIQKINPHSKAGKFLLGVPTQVLAFEVNEVRKCTK